MNSQSERLLPDTIASKAYRLIRDDILNGVFPPGMHLAKRVLAKKYGVSVPPIIEACLRLENDGLIENSPLLGSYVMNVFPEKIEDELIFREAIECQVARVFAVRASNRDKEQILRLADTIDAIQARIDRDNREAEKEFQEQHSQFHLLLAKLSGAALLYQQVKKLWFRRFMLIWNADKITFKSPRDWHRQLALALSSGDPDQAERVMRQHLTLNTEKKTEAVLKDLYREKGQYLEELLNEEDTVVGAPGK